MIIAIVVLFLPLCLHIIHVVQWSNGMRGAFKTQQNEGALLEPLVQLTVVLPVRNEAGTLPLLLADLAAQTHLPCEVIVVDDASDDGTLESLTKNGLWPFPLTSLANPGSGKKAGLSAGLKATSSSWVLGVDADTRLGPEALCAMAQGISTTGPSKDMLLLPLRIATQCKAPPKTHFHRLQALDFAAMQGWAVSAVRKGHPAMASGGGWLWRTDAFPHGQLRPDIPSGDDVFALAALIERGDHSRVGWLGDPRSMVSAAPMHTLTSLLDQRIRWGAKATQYPRSLKAARRVAVAMAAMHLAGLILLFVHPLSGLAFWGVKTTVDIAYTHQMGRAYRLFSGGHFHALTSLIALAVVHPLFISTTLLLMPFRKVRWKGRTAM